MLKDMPFSKKWVGTLLFVAICATSIIFTLLTGLKYAKKDLQKFVLNEYLAKSTIEDTRINVLKTARDIRDVYIQAEQGDTLKLINEIQQNKMSIKAGIDELSSVTEDINISMQGYEEAVNNWMTIVEQVIQTIEIGDKAEAEILMAHNEPEALDKVIQEAMQMSDKINISVMNMLNTNIKSINNISLMALFIFFVAVIISTILSRKIRHSVLDPLEEIKGAVEEIGRGNYDISIDYKSKDEFGVVADSVRTMISFIKSMLKDTTRSLSEIAEGNFNISSEVEYIGSFRQIESNIQNIIYKITSILKQIRQSSREVSHISLEMANGSRGLAADATKEACIIEEFIASIEDITENINKNIGQVNETSEISRQTKEKVTEATDVMNRMFIAIQAISKSSQNISDVIKVIDDIANQTNLLALNAAIESARAGESGRGFAVVANEIRELANKSSEAVKDIHHIIAESLESVSEGQDMVQYTSQALKGVALAADGAVEKTNDLLKNSEDQKTFIRDLLEGTRELSVLVEKNSKNAQETATISEELASQAENLESLIKIFKLKSDSV